MEKLVFLGHRDYQESQDFLVAKDKRVSVERVSQAPVAPQVYLGLLDLALVTAQRLLTWRVQGSQIWTKYGVPVVPQVFQVLLALLGSRVLLWLLDLVVL